MACACKNKNRTRSNAVVKRAQNAKTTVIRTTNGMRKVIRRELK